MVWNDITNALSEDFFPPSPGRLCDWCSFKDRCPAFADGSNPAPDLDSDSDSDTDWDPSSSSDTDSDSDVDSDSDTDSDLARHGD